MKLNLGCGVHLKKGFINVDIIKEKDLRDGHRTKKGPWKNTVIDEGAEYVEADIRKMPFKDDSAEVVELFSVLEHMPFRDVVPALKEIYRVMKKRGLLIITTDDFDGMATDWFRMRMGQFDLNRYVDVMETIYGNQMHEGEFHKTAMTPDFLNWCLITAGFQKGELTVYPKNASVPKIGSKPKGKPGAVFRNDQLVAKVVK